MLVMPLRFATALRAAPLLVAVAACSRLSDLRDELRRATPHERYAHALERAGLAGTALARRWTDAAVAARTSAPVLALPLRQVGVFSEAEPSAPAIRFAARRGERVAARFEVAGDSTTLVFIDLFAVDDTLPSGEPSRTRPLASADSGERHLTVEVPRTGSYVLRAQPELLRGGRYSFVVEIGPSLAFPLPGANARAIQSLFGADRDGGARRHQGVDIFAPRGTPVTASAAGVVTRTGVTTLGGKVVWLYDARRGQALYYAHLDQQLVESGARVEIGDTLGLVGNTGNARTTPPHLHFGIYRRGEGALDPLPFIDPRQRPLPAVTADTGPLGTVTQVAATTARLRVSPTEDAPVVLTLPRHTAVRVDAAIGRWYRVRVDSAEGAGFVRATELR
jgi:murein DD-endopeptidase MepM/ murein hydrolase activator NlpD